MLVEQFSLSRMVSMEPDKGLSATVPRTPLTTREPIEQHGVDAMPDSNGATSLLKPKAVLLGGRPLDDLPGRSNHAEEGRARTAEFEQGRDDKRSKSVASLVFDRISANNSRTTSHADDSIPGRVSKCRASSGISSSGTSIPIELSANTERSAVDDLILGHREKQLERDDEEENIPIRSFAVFTHGHQVNGLQITSPPPIFKTTNEYDGFEKRRIGSLVEDSALPSANRDLAFDAVEEAGTCSAQSARSAIPTDDSTRSLSPTTSLASEPKEKGATTSSIVPREFPRIVSPLFGNSLGDSHHVEGGSSNVAFNDTEVLNHEKEKLKSRVSVRKESIRSESFGNSLKKLLCKNPAGDQKKEKLQVQINDFLEKCTKWDFIVEPVSQMPTDDALANAKSAVDKLVYRNVVDFRQKYRAEADSLSRPGELSVLVDVENRSYPPKLNMRPVGQLLRTVLIDAVAIAERYDKLFSSQWMDMPLFFHQAHSFERTLPMKPLVELTLFFLLRGHKTILLVPSYYNPSQAPKVDKVDDPKALEVLTKLGMIIFLSSTNGCDCFYEAMLQEVDRASACFVSTGERQRVQSSNFCKASQGNARILQEMRREQQRHFGLSRLRAQSEARTRMLTPYFLASSKTPTMHFTFNVRGEAGTSRHEVSIDTMLHYSEQDSEACNDAQRVAFQQTFQEQIEQIKGLASVASVNSRITRGAMSICLLHCFYR